MNTYDRDLRKKLLQPFPIGSPLLFEYDCKERHKIHRQRVRSARAVIDTAPPEDYVHFHYNAKKCMLHAERLYEIERENRILLEKMTKYAEYNGAKHLRPWTFRSTVNYAPGLVLAGQGLHIDNLNIPANPGTPAGGNRTTEYKKRQDLENFAKENMRLKKKIAEAYKKPAIARQKLEHEWRENVSRIDRLSTFRGPRSASYRASRVKEDLDVAKDLRNTQHLPGTRGYAKDMARSVSRHYSKSARASIGRHDGVSTKDSNSRESSIHRQGHPPRSYSAKSPSTSPSPKFAGLGAYVQEAARSMNKRATFNRSASRRVSYAVQASPSAPGESKPAGAPLLTPEASVQMVAAEGSQDHSLEEPATVQLPSALSLLEKTPAQAPEL